MVLDRFNEFNETRFFLPFVSMEVFRYYYLVDRSYYVFFFEKKSTRGTYPL